MLGIYQLCVHRMSGHASVGTCSCVNVCPHVCVCVCVFEGYVFVWSMLLCWCQWVEGVCLCVCLWLGLIYRVERGASLWVHCLHPVTLPSPTVAAVSMTTPYKCSCTFPSHSSQIITLMTPSDHNRPRARAYPLGGLTSPTRCLMWGRGHPVHTLDN